ncbi:MAG: TRAM domain-containing protein [archaeon GB-1867-097]|nr:TRAM domain-containing protein [Candidatus Verstraetearchaeota archaeon]MCS7373608.1 TRAM domain-containing protein [Candidatus Culexmicrobium thermophilum]MCS7384285.1 TRAM domain-containing protein [Candidatus Culexmicrobium thermophilum]RLE55322.1 MAG: deoxyribonuclease [Candidatus Verstraetearchaeota archaeon]HDO20774.1 TRAM domain-containing protein [Candidatus Bathyarchaeota archaeon]
MPRRIHKRRSGKRGSSSKKYSFRKLREGEIYTVVIEDYSNKGEGIAKVKDTILFIPGGKIGEIVKVKVTSVKFKKAMASIIDRKGSIYE